MAGSIDSSTYHSTSGALTVLDVVKTLFPADEELVFWIKAIGEEKDYYQQDSGWPYDSWPQSPGGNRLPWGLVATMGLASPRFVD